MLYFRELWALRDTGTVLGTPGWNSHQNQPSPDEQSSDLSGTHCFLCPRDRLIHCSCSSEKAFTPKNPPCVLQDTPTLCCSSLGRSRQGRENQARECLSFSPKSTITSATPGNLSTELPRPGRQPGKCCKGQATGLFSF